MKLGIVKIKLCGKHMYDFRIVVQPGRTLRSGRRGRWFESSQSDHKKSHPCGGFFYGQTGFLNQQGSWFDQEERQTGKSCFEIVCFIKIFLTLCTICCTY